MERTEHPQFIPSATLVQDPLLKTANAPLRGDIGMYEKFPRRIICQFCNQEVLTRVEFKNGIGTHLTAGGLCIIGCVSAKKLRNKGLDLT